MSGRHIRVLDIFSLYQEKKTSPNIFFLTYSISDKYKKNLDKLYRSANHTVLYKSIKLFNQYASLYQKWYVFEYS
jgi:hypothetical protein